MGRGRKPSVNYWSTRNNGCYGGVYKGKQYTLAIGPQDYPDGPTYQAALKKFGQLMAFGSLEEAKDNNTVRIILESYLHYLESIKCGAGTFGIRAKYYKAFCAGPLADLPIGQLTHKLVYDWCKTMEQPRKRGYKGQLFRWTDGSIRNCLISLSTAFNWAKSKRANYLITENPLTDIHIPGARSRGREAVLTPDDHARIMARAQKRPYMVEFITVLEATGARPSELVYADCNAFVPSFGAIVYYKDATRKEGEHKHKTFKKDKDRIIILTGEALEIVRRLVEKHKTGRIFRKTGEKELSDVTVNNWFFRQSKTLGIPGLSPYCYRHTLATAWLKQGGSIEILCEILGNTPVVIRQHYSHLLADVPGVRRLFETFREANSTAGLARRVVADMAGLDLAALEQVNEKLAGLLAVRRAEESESQSPAVVPFRAAL